MIEIEKMLHLRRQVLAVIRADAKSRVARSLHSTTTSPCGITSSRVGGYVSRYMHHRYVPSYYVAAELSRANYVACARTFGTTTAESSIDDIDQRLISFCDDVKRGRLSADRLREIIKLCDETDYQLHAKIGLLLIKCCGDSSAMKTLERRDLLDQVWRLVKRNGDAVTLEHYNTVLEVHAGNASTVNPEEFLNDMSVKPDENTYRLLLNAAAKADNIEHLRNIMSMMKERSIPLDENTYAVLIQTYMAIGNTAEAEKLITLAKNATLPINNLYTELACGYATLGDIPNLVKILNDEPQSEDNLLRIVKALSMSGNGRHIPVVLNFLAASIPSIKSKIFKMIAELVREGRATDAHTIINCTAMNEAIASHAKSCVNSFLNELIMTNAPVEDITRYASDYVKSGYDPLALTNIAETGLKLGRESLCHAIFEAMREQRIEIRPHYYWPLLVMAHRNQGETRVFSLVKSMLDAGVELDYDTFVNYVFPYVNTTNPIATLQRLQAGGISNIILDTPIISFLLSQNRLQDAVDLCKQTHLKLHYKELMKPLVRAYIATQDYENCVTLLTIFPAGHEFISLYLITLLNSRRSNFYMEDLRYLLKAFKKHNGKIPQRDATVLKSKLANIFDTVTDNMNLSRIIDDLVDNSLENSALAPILHPRYMNSKELACLLVELKNKDISIRGTLQRMLKLYCNENNLKKAEEVKREFDEKQLKWTPSMKLYMFELYLKHDKLKEAETLLSELLSLSDTFMIDKNKIVMFATGLVNANKPQSAFNLIEKINNVNDKGNAEKQCYTLLNTLAHSDYYAYTKDMLRLLMKKKYCILSVEMLRPLVALSLERNDIPSAMDTFAQCVQQYKKTPLAQELLTALLQQKGSSDLRNMDKYIEQVYNMIVSIHGIEVANTLLAIGLATIDKMEELRSLLQKQTISMSSLMHYSNYAQRHNKMDVLLRILEAISDTSNSYQEVLCDMLLACYSKASDCNSALVLWKMMCAKDIKPSEQFRENFIQFLLSNKVPLPPEFEPDKSEIDVSN